MSILGRVREVLYDKKEEIKEDSTVEESTVEESLSEANEDLEGDGEFESDEMDENDLDGDSVCINLTEDGYCSTGAACANVEPDCDCPYAVDFSFKDCCNFTPISQANDESSFSDEA